MGVGISEEDVAEGGHPAERFHLGRSGQYKYRLGLHDLEGEGVSLGARQLHGGHDVKDEGHAVWGTTLTLSRGGVVGVDVHLGGHRAGGEVRHLRHHHPSLPP